MRVEISVRTTSGRLRDLAVFAPEAALVRDVAGALRARFGACEDAQLWLADHRLVEHESWSACGVRRGEVLGIGGPATAPAHSAVLALHIVGGPEAGRVVPLERGELIIGRDPGCDVVLGDADASRRHAALTVTHTRVAIRDLGSTNGTFVDDRQVSDDVDVGAHAVIRIGACLLTISGPVDAPAALTPAPDGGRRLLVRSPRSDVPTEEADIVLPGRRTWSRPRGVQWISALLPAGAGGAVAWWAHSPQFLLFALLSPVMMLSTALGDRLHWRRSRRRDANTLRRERAAAHKLVQAALARETAQRRRSAPDPAAVARMASVPSCRLWERRRGDDDYLSVRVGSADTPARVRVREGSTTASAGQLRAVPVSVDLRRGPLGLAGPSEVADGIARWIVGQLAALQSPADVELALIASPAAAHSWRWVRWLPHFDGRVATDAEAATDLVADLADRIDQRRALRRSGAPIWSGTWLVIVLDRVSRLGDLPGLTALLEHGSAVGVSALCVDDRVADLPAACTTLAQITGETGNDIMVLDRSSGVRNGAVVDRVSTAWSARLSRDLAPLRDADAAAAADLPRRCSLLDLLGLARAHVDDIRNGWHQADHGARTTLGMTADGPLSLDLVADGPHTLIAGTTGAGKSELLQTLVAGLAAHHPPDAMNFLLIDYKGGAAFADCARLPHTAGLVTDLDPYLTERALRSLRSELRRRERLFAELGASDFEAYRRSGPAEPVARLVIVVDEFASLAEELPEFVRGLVGVAQRGRSLGVHLILATQRPGTAVSAEIRANTSIRIALRVTDPSESTDVIDAPDAATIERGTPGRAYLRAGGSLTCFQTAHATGATETLPDEVMIEDLDEWGRRRGGHLRVSQPSDLTQLVDLLADAAAQDHRPSARSPWLPPLPETLPVTTLVAEGATVIPYARLDLPDEQQQSVVSLDLSAAGSLLVAGGALSGRTTALSTIVLSATERFAPDTLTVHVVDAAQDLASLARALPHAGTVLDGSEFALLPRLLARLCEHHVHASTTPTTDPHSALLLLDGWDRLLAMLPELDAAACGESLATLLRLGPASGVTIVVTGDRSLLTPRFSGAFSEKILLRLTDRADYALAGIASRAVPNAMPPGRGLWRNGTALQIAHVGERPDPTTARDCARAIADAWVARGAPVGSPAVRIRALPERVHLTTLRAPRGSFVVGLGGDDVECLTFAPFGGSRRFLVAGPPRSGRSTTLQSLAQQAVKTGVNTVVAALPRSGLATTARQLSLPLVTPASSPPATPPDAPTVLLVDDSEGFLDGPAGERLAAWLREDWAPLCAVVAGRSDELATSYRGLGAEVRRSRCGLLLRPGPVDGELLGVRLPRRPSTGPPGRGVVVGDPDWSPLFASGEPVPVQVATP